MTLTSLDEAADAARPDGRHWIIPGAVREGAKILLSGNVAEGKTLVALECAVSAFTFSRFMGILPPWVAARPVVLTSNPHDTVRKLRLLLDGRGEADATGLDLITCTGDMDWKLVCAALLAQGKKLIVIDDYHHVDPSTYYDLLQALRPNVAAGATVFVTQQTAMALPHPYHVQPEDKALLQDCEDERAAFHNWFDVHLFVRKDSASEAIEVTGASGVSVAKAIPMWTRDSLTWEPYPAGVELTRLETEVWRSMYRLKQTTIGAIAKDIDMSDKARKRLVQDALDSLKAKDVADFEMQYKGVGGKQFRVWSVRLPER